MYSLPRSIPTICLAGENESEEISSEIDIVMGHELQIIAENYRLNKNAHSLLHDSLQRTPNKTYLWLHLVLAEIRGSIVQDVIVLERLLDALPRTVEAAYKKVLDRCSGEEAKRGILQIILAAQRPLTLMEIGVALEIDEALKKSSDPASSFLLFKDLGGESETTRIAVRDACGVFISIVDSRVVTSQTAKEFLLREMEEPSERTKWRNSIDIRNAHRVLSRICLTYLLFPEIQNFFPSFQRFRAFHSRFKKN